MSSAHTIQDFLQHSVICLKPMRKYTLKNANNLYNIHFRKSVTNRFFIYSAILHSLYGQYTQFRCCLENSVIYIILYSDNTKKI